MIDLGTAATRLAGLLAGVQDEQLARPTPCSEYSLADLIDHVNGLSLGLAAAATKDFGALTGSAPSGNATELGTGWRERIATQLDALAAAWREPSAWEGMTQAGGVDLPGEVAGVVTLDELVVHGWDIARATGQDFAADQTELQACEQVLGSLPRGENGPFGSVVTVADNAPLLDRVIGLSGRDPSWTPQ